MEDIVFPLGNLLMYMFDDTWLVFAYFYVIFDTGREEPLSFKPADPDTYETAYVPKHPGIYTINLQYGGGHIQKSPFKVGEPHTYVTLKTD